MMEAGFVDRFDSRVSQSVISSQSVLSECRTFSWHWSLAKNKETRTIVEWKQIRCSIKKYKSGGKVGGVRNMLRAGKKDEEGWERTWRWSQMRLSISPLSLIMDHFHREPTESKPEVTEKRPQANRSSTPVSAYIHSSAVTRRLYLQPSAWSSSPSSSPLPKFWTCQNVWGTRWTGIPIPSARDAKGRWLSPLHVRVKTQGGGMLLRELFCLFRFRRLTWPPLPSAGSGSGPQKQAGGRLGWAPVKAST